jgi:hypothetical protein
MPYLITRSRNKVGCITTHLDHYLFITQYRIPATLSPRDRPALLPPSIFLSFFLLVSFTSPVNYRGIAAEARLPSTLLPPLPLADLVTNI